MIFFFNPQKLFYVIMGTDGIGKTITALYYSSFIHTFRILYLNLKLLSKENKEGVENIILNEIKRIFLTNYKMDINIYYDLFNQIKATFEEQRQCKMNGIDYAWELLFAFLNKYITFSLFKTDLLIILVQYKKEIDNNYTNLNNLCSKIEKYGHNLMFTFKVIIIISINNYDTKRMFLENLSVLSFESSNINNNFVPISNFNSNLREKNIKNYSNIKDSSFLNDNYELEDIEHYLDKNSNEINKKFNEYIKNMGYLLNDANNSKCLLNNKYFDLTQKEYLNNNIDCTQLIETNLNKIYKKCIKVFGKSPKYFQLLLLEIKETKREKGENDEKYGKRILNTFYSKMYLKIYLNILKSYDYLTDKSKVIILNIHKTIVENLVELRDLIYEKKKFKIDMLKNILENLPVKYLNVFLAYSKDLSQNVFDYGNFEFYLDYSNNFIKHAFNKFIKDYSKDKNVFQFNITGLDFEKNVNNKLSNLEFNKTKIKTRNIFALVGISKTTKKYVNNLREKEDIEYINFIGAKSLKLITIDGIDTDKVKEQEFDIKNNDVFLNQISKTGRSFDSGLLLRKNMNDYTHDLILFQMTIFKIVAVKDKDIYINDSIQCKEYLENLYEGLKIDKIYIIFVLPEYALKKETIKKLDQKQIYYIYFSELKNLFFTKESKAVEDFRIKESNITYEYDDFAFLTTLSNIQICKDNFEEAKTKYLMKKNINIKFGNILEKLLEKNCHQCIKLFIPIKLKKNIVNAITAENFFPKETSINFIPSANYDGIKFKTIFDSTKNLTIFSYRNNIYFYFISFFQIKDDYSLEKIENLKIKENKNKIVPNNDLIKFENIKDYPLFSFCFLVIGNYNIIKNN